jgi:hypothetical protein
MIVWCAVCPSTIENWQNIPDSVSVELKDRNPEEAYVGTLFTFIPTQPQVVRYKANPHLMRLYLIYQTFQALSP